MTTPCMIRFLVLAPGILLSGCFGGKSIQQQALSQKRTFLPLVEIAAPVVTVPRFAAVKIRQFRVLAPYDTRAFIVRRTGGEAVADFYNAWLVAPHELIRSEVTRYLEATRLFAAVHGVDCGTATPLGLEGIVSELYLDYAGSVPAAVVTMRFLILDERAPSFTMRFTTEQQVRVPFDPKLKNGASLAFSQALTQTLKALVDQLAQAVLPPAETP